MPAVSMVSNATPTCCWDVVVTIRVLKRRAQWAAKMSFLTFSSHSVGRETAETSPEEVTIKGHRDGKLVHSEHPMKKPHKPLPFPSLMLTEDTQSPHATTANETLSRNLQHKKDCVGYLVKATANETSTGALSGSPWSLFGRHIGPALNVKGVRDTRGQLGGPTDTTLCIAHTSVVQDTCS